MTIKKRPKFILAYFSGTGGTKVASDSFEEQLMLAGEECIKFDIATDKISGVETGDTIVILSPVYAFRLASITEKWIKKLPDGKGVSAVIVSVSGGGEVSPNTACRLKCKRLLTRKGFQVQYEEMLVMPSNFGVQAENNVNKALLKVLPNKVNKIITDILSGKNKITSPLLRDRLFAVIGKSEHFGARIFGLLIRTSQECTGCGLCVHDCPTNNITMKNGTPRFGFRCIWCLKCIYKCPSKALLPGIVKSSVLKNGFDMEKMIDEVKHEPKQINDIQRDNIYWKDVIDYIYSDENIND